MYFSRISYSSRFGGESAVTCAAGLVNCQFGGGSVQVRMDTQDEKL